MPIENFEEQTHDLTPYEIEKLLPNIVKNLAAKIGEKNRVSSTQIIKAYKDRGQKMSGARLRKIINHIRKNNLVYNLISDNKGYYVATGQNECLSYIRSLDQRINEITSVRDAMQYQLDQTIKNRAQSKSA